MGFWLLVSKLYLSKVWSENNIYELLVDKIILCADSLLWNLSTQKLEPPKFAFHV